MSSLIRSLKAHLRAEIKSRLSLALISSPSFALTCSHAIVLQLLEIDVWKDARGVSVFLSMPSAEVQTMELIKECFANQKRVFIPKITGGNPEDMKMYELDSIEEISSFELTKWGIPEPSLDQMNSKPDATMCGIIDLVILPGVGFDKQGGRLGHGKGYYDSFIERVSRSNASLAVREPSTIGVCFNEQLMEEPIPSSHHDRKVELVITPSEIFK